MAKDTRNDFSVGSIPKYLVKLALPMMAAELINALYSVVDKMYIGRIEGVGTQALTGLGICFPIIMIIAAFTSLFGQGGAPQCSIERGRGNDEKAERIMGTSFTLLVSTGIILTILCLIFKKPVLYAFGASDASWKYANEYITIYCMGSIFVMISVGMNAFINAQGFARIGLFTVAIGAILNIALDPLFIFKFGLGIKGAAWATVISQFISAAWALQFLCSKKSILRLKLSMLKPDWGIAVKVVSLGVSTFCFSITNSLISAISNSAVRRLGGDSYVACMTVISSVRQIFMMPLQGFSNASRPIIGYNYGARKYRRVRTTISWSSALCITVGIVMWALIELFPRSIMQIFSNDAALIELGVKPVRIYFLLNVFIALQLCGQVVFVGLNKPRYAIFFSLLRKVVIVLPLIFILPNLFGLGVFGVFWSEPISDVLGGSACFITMLLTVWRRMTTDEELPASPPAES